MKKFQKILLTTLAAIHLFGIPTIAQAQVLPYTAKTTKECRTYLSNQVEIKKQLEAPKTEKQVKDDILGCAIKTGKITFWMAPFYITYAINFILAFGGLISTLFIVIGGYQYIIGGATGKSDSGKETLKYAIIGLIVSLMAWIIVNIVQYTVT